VRSAAAVVVATMLIALISGCAQQGRENIPTYPPIDAVQSLQHIRERLGRIHSASGEGAITLIDTHGQSVRLDAAFVFAPPDHARVRAWKVGQAILDLTMMPDGVWMYLPRRDSHAEQLKSATSEASSAVRQWLGLLTHGVDSFDDSQVQATAREIVLTRSEKNDVRLICKIDRSTLTIRRYEMTDERSRALFALALSRYQSYGDLVWPTRVEATSNNGRVIVEMRDVELNGPLAEGAFKPPSRAESLP
jgi:outer membrane lipoprotein-sorting protein